MGCATVAGHLLYALRQCFTRMRPIGQARIFPVPGISPSHFRNEANLLTADYADDTDNRDAIRAIRVIRGLILGSEFSSFLSSSLGTVKCLRSSASRSRRLAQRFAVST